MSEAIEVKSILETLPKDELLKLLSTALQNNTTQIDRIEFESLIKKHKIYVRNKDLSEATTANYRKAYEHFKDFYINRGLIYADEMTYDIADEFYNCLRAKELTQRTAISYYKMIKAMYAYALRRNHIIKNTFENKVFPTSQVSEWWTDEYVYQQLIPAIRKHARAPNKEKTELKVRLTYTTGLRAGIIHRIRRKDVMLKDDGAIYLNTKCKVPKRAAIQRVTTKILNKETKNMMRQFIKQIDEIGIETDSLIFTKRRAKTGYHNYWETLVKVCKKAGIKYLSPHKAKHGFVTTMAQNGLTAEQICKLTGNRTPSLMHAVYMHLNTGSIEEMAEKIINQNNNEEVQSEGTPEPSTGQSSSE